jgi:hypothetical protein
MLTNKILRIAIAVAAFSLCQTWQAADAQSSTTLHTPLIPGAVSSPPFVCPPEGQPPAIGDGPTPAPVVPGHTSPPTLLPWIPAIPANQIDNGTSGIPLPVGPPIETPPGVLGPMLTPFIPGPPSTPGPDPGSLTAPDGFINPAQEININPEGGIPGTGGYNTTIPTQRRGGQETHQWELRGRNSSLIPGMGDGSQDQVTRLGPWAGWGVPFGVPTGSGLRNSSIDLGGGQRFQVGGGCIIPTGSTVIDYGLNPMREHWIDALSAQQATEFGQGMRRIPRFSHKTTDFGFPYAQFDPANTNPQKQDQLLLPTAVITNF